MSRSRGGKSRTSRLSRTSLMGERRGGGDGLLSLLSRSKSRSRSRSRSALQELCEFGCGCGCGALDSGGASRSGVASPRPGKPLPRPSRGADGTPEVLAAVGPRGASPGILGPLGTSLGTSLAGKLPASEFDRGFGSLALGGYPLLYVDCLLSRYGDRSRPYLLLSGYRDADMVVT
jgi:hypothetical protein